MRAIFMYYLSEFETWCAQSHFDLEVNDMEPGTWCEHVPALVVSWCLCGTTRPPSSGPRRSRSLFKYYI